MLSIEELVVEFKTQHGVLRAADHVNLQVVAGETLGVVGESGSGKSVTFLSAIGLIATKGGHAASGRVLFRGEDLLTMPQASLRRIRGRHIAMVFQDPQSSFNPVLTVGDQLTEAIRIHQPGVSKAAARSRAIELMTLVGIPAPADRFGRHPHEFSGGMRQRVMIAMAIANEPSIIIADEPTTALDVTVQAQILSVLKDIQRRLDVALVLITHDLAVIAETADRVAVMYGGRVVETAGVVNLFHNPQHPYTVGLMASLPHVESESDRLVPIPGAPPDLTDLPSGCIFHPRCALSRDRTACRTLVPSLSQRLDDAGHLSACHFAAEVPEYSRSVGQSAGIDQLREVR